MSEDVPLSSSSLPPLIPFLTDDISTRCIARVPISSHTALAQVSRSWRSFVRSPSFFSLRSELAVTEPILTVSIRHRFHLRGRSRWYHLHPYQTPSPLPPTLEREHGKGIGSASASLGPHLFLIGGMYPSENSIQIYDARLRRWSHGPPLSTPRRFATAGIAGGRVHVLGGCINSMTAPSAESLDPTGSWWDPVPPIPAHLLGNCTFRSAVMDGKLFVVSEGDGHQMFAAAFDPDTTEWAPAPPWCVVGDRSLPPPPLAVVGGVPYVFSYVREYRMARILGYDNDGQWRPVEGELEKELLCHVRNVTLQNFGGLLCLIGEEKEGRVGVNMISCAGIDISRTDNGGFRGSIVWLDSGLLKLEASLDHCVVLEL